jgi:hypothetical protein
MKKINKTFSAIFKIFKDPWLLNNVLSDNTVWKNYIAKNYKKEYLLPVVDIQELIPGFSETINSFAFLDGGSLPIDIALLQSLSKKFKDCKYFEIGTWRGESVANVANFAKECYSLNLSKEELLRSGMSNEYADMHYFFSRNKPNITHITGNSFTYDFASIKKKFDLIFIDGNHHYEYVKNDTEKIFNNLIHEKSIIVWHDYAFTPEKIRYEVLAAILDGTPLEKRNNLYQVSNTLCAIFINEKLPSKKLVAPEIPTKTFQIKITAKDI